MAKLANLARMTTATVGTGTITLGSAVSGYLDFATAGITTGQVVRYAINDGASSEAGFGTYTTAGTTLTRSVRTSTNSNNAISLSGSAQVFITPLAEDFLNVSQPQGRLTLQTAIPVMTTTQSAKTTIFYTPYVGQYVPIYDGTSFNMTDTGGEISVLTTDATKSPAAIGASKVNDWFVWNDAGTIRIGHGPDWTNDTTRSAGTALVMVNGILLNNASITNGAAASRGTYVGTTRSNGSSQLDWIFGTSAAGGGQAWFGVWNAYNRINVTTNVQDSTTSYVYSSATIRSADASTNNRISFVSGLAEDGIPSSYSNSFTSAAVQGSFGIIGVGLDSTTATDRRSILMAQSAFAASVAALVSHVYPPQLGFHFIQALESGDGTNSYTFNPNTLYNGLEFSMRM